MDDEPGFGKFCTLITLQRLLFDLRNLETQEPNQLNHGISKKYLYQIIHRNSVRYKRAILSMSIPTLLYHIDIVVISDGIIYLYFLRSLVWSIHKTFIATLVLMYTVSSLWDYFIVGIHRALPRDWALWSQNTSWIEFKGVLTESSRYLTVRPGRFVRSALRTMNIRIGLGISICICHVSVAFGSRFT